MVESRPIKVSFSFYPDDVDALARRLQELEHAGDPAKEATVLRALIHLTSADEMYAWGVRFTAQEALASKAESRPTVSSHPTIDAAASDLDKVDGVLDRLARAGITQSRSFIVRALVHSAPKGKALATVLQRFRDEVPNKPRGLSKLRLEAKRRPHA